MSDDATPAPTPSPAPASEQAPASAADALAPAAPAANWRDSLAEDLRGEQALANFADINALARGYMDTKRLASSRVPTPGETPESFKAFAAAVRPQDATVYEIAVPEGMPTEFADGFRAKAHEIGLHPIQAKAIADWNNEMVAADLRRQSDASAADLAAFKADYNKAGGNFDQKLDAVKAWLPQMGVQLEPKDMAALDAKIGSGNLMRFMFELHDRVGDLPEIPADDLPSGFGAMTPAQADARQRELYKDASWREKALQQGSAEWKENERLTKLVAQGRYQQQRGGR